MHTLLSPAHPAKQLSLAQGVLGRLIHRVLCLFPRILTLRRVMP